MSVPQQDQYKVHGESPDERPGERFTSIKTATGKEEAAEKFVEAVSDVSRNAGEDWDDFIERVEEATGYSIDEVEKLTGIIPVSDL